MLTYFDAIEHLITTSFGGSQDAEQKDIRLAIQRSFDEVAYIKDWEFYITHGRINFEPTWSGTVTFDVSTNTLTKQTGEAFPANAKYYKVRIGNVVANVATRSSDSALILDSTLTFNANISSATAATLYRSVYPMPSDFRSIDSPIDENTWTSFRYVTPDQAMKMERAQDVQGSPSYWTVVKDPDSLTGFALKVLGYPTQTETLDFTYRRTPRQLRLSGHETASRAGTIASSGTAITGTASTFSSDMVGSILRVGTTALHPDTLNSVNPFKAEVEIATYTSATAIAIANTIGTYSGVKYIVTDPVDAPPHMTNCILSCAEYWLARTRNQDTEDKFGLYQRDLRLGMESDQLAPMSGSSRVVWDTYGWRSPLKEDNFVEG
jgi:hypothetical protein